MQLIDTHTHINLQAFAGEEAATIKRAHDAGVVVVNVGTQIDTSKQAVSLLEQFPNDVYAVVGLHPNHTYAHDFVDESEVSRKTIEQHFDYGLYKALADRERVVGIGECGLDYYRLPERGDMTRIKELQRIAFEEQIKLALELNKALCIHCRPSEGSQDAYEEVYEMLGRTKSENPGLRFEIHCYTGNLEMAQKFSELGGYIGLNGIITFDKTGRSETVVKGSPLSAIILETDAPYLTPQSQRGKRNEPSFLPEVAQKIADWKSVSIEEVASVTTQNARKLFNL